MPREVITRPDPPQPVTNGATGEPDGEWTNHGLSIGWSAGGEWLQVYIQPFGSKDTSEWTIAALDRNGANRLIRAVRKARDAAFGSDA